MKSKLPLGKKAKDEDEELEEIEEEDSDSSRQDDATDATDISALADSDEEEEEAEEENASILDKIKNKIKSLQKKSPKDGDEDSEESEEDADDEEAKKKKKSKIIQIAIGGALVVFLLSDYIIPPDEEPAPAGDEIVEGPPADQPATAETPVEVKPDAPVEAKPDAPVTEPTPPVETAETPVETAPTTTETTPDSPVEVTSTETPSEPVEEPAVDFPTETAETPSDIPIEPMGGETSTDTIGEDMGQAGDENLTDQILQDLEKQAKGTETTEQKKEYVSPPDYEYRGRGLVYNCSGKHWACVDAPSYKACEDNNSSVKYLNKKVECYPFNVYETTRGCESMQNRMVSSNATTKFCAE